MKNKLTIRDELAKRLNAKRRCDKKHGRINPPPESFNASLGIGKLPKNRDKPFTGFGIDNYRYINGKPMWGLK